MYCSNCGEELNDKAVICVNCGVSTENLQNSNQPKGSGAYGISSFILSFIALGLPIAYIDILVGVISVILGIIGTRGDKSKKGLAIAGIVIASIAILGATAWIIENPGELIYSF